MSTAAATALTSLMVCTPAVAFQQASSSQAKPTFRSAVDLVSIAAVVRDRHGRFARGLRKEDFVIEEEGARRDIVEFHADENAPVRIALLFDVSGSMRLATRLEDARQTARQLVSALRLGSEQDEVAVFSFDMNLQSLQSFTSDPNAIENALARVAPSWFSPMESTRAAVLHPRRCRRWRPRSTFRCTSSRWPPTSIATRSNGRIH